MTRHDGPLGPIAAVALAAVALSAAACGGPAEPEVVEPTPGLRTFTGARLITGDGGAIDNGTMVVRDGMIETLGAADAVEIPADAATIDLAGRTVTPGLINAHGHVNNVRGLESDPSFYTEEHIRHQLGLYARYGVTTVASLGGGGPEGVRVRDSEDASLAHARLRLSGPVIVGDDPDAAAAMVNEVADMGVDFIKIRVDDNLGNSQKMTPAVYTAVIDAAHARGLKLTSHLYYLDDAKGLLEAGTDFIAHSVRDVPVDDAFISMMQEAGICYCPTLMREVSTYVYGERPDWFDNPFFLREADVAVVAQLEDPARMEGVRNSSSAQTYREQIPTAMANLKAVYDAGIPVAMGTDTGPAARFQGYFEHGELALMAESGMPSMDVIVASTKNAAECLGLENLGMLAPGYHADFVVYTADPSVDVTNSTTIESVWVAGSEVPGSSASN